MSYQPTPEDIKRADAYLAEKNVTREDLAKHNLTGEDFTFFSQLEELLGPEAFSGRKDDTKILFVIQDANFCPKILTVPTSEFTAARNEDLKLLIQHAKKTDDGAFVLIQNHIWSEGCGTMEMHPWSHITSDVMRVACYGDVPRHGDEDWVAKSSIIETSLFDPHQVFSEARARLATSYAFLVLEAKNGVVGEKPPVKDVKEMYEQFYS